MKNLVFSLLLLILATTVSAQTLVKGDMNDDGQVTIADVTSMVNVVVGKNAVETLNLNPYGVDNSLVVGRWYGPDGSNFELRADGTTDYPGSSTYEFMPSLGRLLFLDGSGNAVKGLAVWKVERGNMLLLMDYATGAITRYVTSEGIAENIWFSDRYLSLNRGESVTLTPNVYPHEASQFLTWTSSDTNVATVDQNGVVTAVNGGTCFITCASAYNPDVKDSCEVYVRKTVTSITLNHQLWNLERNDYFQLHATVLPADAFDQSVTWTCSDNNVVEIGADGTLYTKNFGSCIVTCTANDGSGVSATCYIYVTESLRSYVDLGLPSGTLWAISNVGASSSAEYGDYIAWGETTAKSSYGWSTYRYGGAYAVTEYCPKSSYGANGYTDSLTELEPGDDAATANWGSDWCTPSVDQCKELYNSSYTTSTWTTLEGVNGKLIISKSNGNFIFLPAGGRQETYLYSCGEFGYYWSRSLYASSPNAARLLFFTSSYSQINSYSRCFGVPVRPVRVSQ